MTKYYFCVIAILLFVNQPISAQKVTAEEKIEIQNRVKNKVEEFQASLSKIVNKDLSPTVRKEHVTLMLKLFIGEGEPYDYYDYELEENVHSSGVRMQTSSVTRGTKNWQKLKAYIYKLYNPETGKSSMPYTEIKIESVNAVRVDNIDRVGDHYECVAYFLQKYIGYREGKPVYGDVTSKKVKCYIKNLDIPDVGTVWDAKLGDIYVTSTEKL